MLVEISNGENRQSALQRIGLNDIMLDRFILPVVVILALHKGTRAGKVGHSEYSWTPAPWGDCWHQYCGPGGQQLRPLTCTHRPTGRPAVNDTLCSAADRPATVRPCFRVCDHHVHMYRWTVGPWSRCGPPPDRTAPCSDEYGVQHRNVTCVSICGSPLVAPPDDDQVCGAFVPSPPSQRVCRLRDCSRDCVVTDFGPLTACDSCWTRWKVRHRSVLAAPTGGGANCTRLVETTACPERDECREYRHTNFRYRVGQWTDCTAFYSGDKLSSRGFRSVLGQRRRTVDCINVNGQTMEKSFCSHTKKPTIGELCVLSESFCEAALISDWTDFGQSQYGVRSHDPTAPNRNSNAEKANNERKDVCSRKQLPNDSYSDSDERYCQKYKWIVGEWDICTTQQPSDICGTGIQNRTLLCVTVSDSVPVSDFFCLMEPPVHIRLCSVPCPLDCLVSEWSQWSECLPDKCRLERNKSKDGYRRRVRTVLRTPQNGGSPCPHLNETQTCEYLLCYTWKTTATSDCRLKYSDMQCGEGTRNRTSACVSILGGVVSSRLCFDSKPNPIEVCYLPCANDCVTSDWSDWSQCSKTCGAGRIVGYRSRFRDVLASAGQDGAPCPPVRMLVEKERCADNPCFTYNWQTTEWSECRPLDQRCQGDQCSMTSSDGCGGGFQTRETVCYKSNGEKQPVKKCLLEDMPPSTRNCSLPCSVHCQLSEFTDWSNCAVTCISDETEFLPMQWRHRFVLRVPSFAPGCGPLTEQRPCMNLARCPQFRWHATEWSQCMFYSHADRCGSGYKAREVRCIGERDEYVANDVCSSHLFGAAPAVTQPCRVGCDQDACRFSDWTPWTVCTERCSGYQSRTRSMEGTTSRMADCYDRFKYGLLEQRPCSCPKHSIQLTGLWSHCVLDVDQDFSLFLHQSSIWQRRPGHGYCGVGKRSHALVCVSPQGHNVSAAICSASEFMEEMCFVSCPRDCHMSSWSEWSKCLPEGRCGNGLQSRSRYVIEPSLDGGRDCLPLTDGEEHQTIPCHLACDDYHWHTEEWSACTPTVASESECGAGMQSRNVRCLRVDSSDDGDDDDDDDHEVDESLCDDLTKPFEINYCHVPCPGQCVVSSWSGWSECKAGCVGSIRRRRFRSIIRHPAAGSGTVCPHLEEFERCDSGIGCHSYTWRWTNWSVCIPYGDDVECGSGRRIRYGECVRDDGIVTSRDLCNGLPETIGLSSLLISEESCKIPCPVDCVVSEWTTWTPCSLTCGLGVQTRSRSVLVFTQHRGRHCPDPLAQQRYCAYRECFRWRISEWDPCQMEVSSCGYGTQSRVLSCQRHDGVTVDDGLCDVHAKSYFRLRQSCLFPCPTDCHVSQWSIWGPCHRLCDASPQTEGQQTRSRVILAKPQEGGAPCPSDVIETRPCVGGYCPTYSWHTSYWSSDSRYVWCQRSDGLIVHGACRESEKPYAIRTCNPPCVGVHSLCVDGNNCACESGHEGVYSEGKLVRCDRIRANRSQTEDASNSLWIYVIFGSSIILVICVVAIVLAIGRTLKREKQSNQAYDAALSVSSQKLEIPNNGQLNPTIRPPSSQRYTRPVAPVERNINQTTSCAAGNQSTDSAPHPAAPYWQAQERNVINQIDWKEDENNRYMGQILMRRS